MWMAVGNAPDYRRRVVTAPIVHEPLPADFHTFGVSDPAATLGLLKQDSHTHTPYYRLKSSIQEAETWEVDCEDQV